MRTRSTAPVVDSRVPQPIAHSTDMNCCDRHMWVDTHAGSDIRVVPSVILPQKKSGKWSSIANAFPSAHAV